MTFNKPISLSGMDGFDEPINLTTPVIETVETPIVSEPVQETPIQAAVEETPIKESLITESDSSGEVELTQYEEIINKFSTLGYIQALPEGVESVNDAATFEKVFEYNLKLRDEELVKQTVEQTRLEEAQNLNDSLPELLQQALIYNSRVSKDGGDTIEFIKNLLTISDVVSLDETDPIQQRKIVADYLSQTMEKDDATDFIEEINKNPEKLEAAAKRYKPKLQELAQKKAVEQAQVQNLYAEEEKKGKQVLAGRCVGILKTGKVMGVPIDKNESQYLLKAMADTIDVKIKGKTIAKDGFDYLSHYHRYNEQGNPELAMLAALLMANPKKVMEHFEKSAAAEVVKQVRSDNQSTQHGSLFVNRKANQVLGNNKGKKFNISHIGI